ncbi:MAG: hypothetical protein AAFW70_11325 [Cyanobacteria bacterium J06635_10]
MSFHVQTNVSPESNLHVLVDKPEFQKTLADLRVQAYKQDKDNSIKNQKLIEKLTEENQRLKEESIELKEINKRLKAEVKRMSK